MRTLAEVLTDRTIEIRHDYNYRMQLAMRDEADYSNDEPQEPQPRILEGAIDLWDFMEMMKRIDDIDKKYRGLYKKEKDEYLYG